MDAEECAPLERIVIARRSLRGRLAWWWAVEAKPALWRHPRLQRRGAR